MDDSVKKFKDALDILSCAVLYDEIKYSLEFDRHDVMKASEIFQCVLGSVITKRMAEKGVSIKASGDMGELFAEDLIKFLVKWVDFHPHEYIKNELKNDPYIIARKANEKA